MNELQKRNGEEMKRLKDEYDNQQQEWLEREMYEANRKHLNERNNLERNL